MTIKKRFAFVVSLATASILLAPLAVSHFNDKEMAQSYRQSWFAMVASNFGPIAAMIKGDMPYDQKRVQAHANDLSALMTLDIHRGFADGTDKGTTRAKPEIWGNKADFKEKMDNLISAVDGLDSAAQNGDKGAVAQQVGAVGKSCKGCHDDYKAKDYLY